MAAEKAALEQRLREREEEHERFVAAQRRDVERMRREHRQEVEQALATSPNKADAKVPLYPSLMQVVDASTVSCHAVIWVAFLSRCQRCCC